MPLPNTRNTDYTPGSPVKSADLNDLQDCIIGAKRRRFTRTFLPKFSIPSSFVAGGNAANGTPGLSVYNSPGGAVTNATFDIPFDEGDRLVNFSYWALGNAAASLTSATLLYAATMPELANQLLSWVDLLRGPVWGLVDTRAANPGTLFVGQVLVAGAWLGVKLTTNAPGYSIGPCIATFDRL